MAGPAPRAIVPAMTEARIDALFPGRWLGGVSLVLAPGILLAGMLLRLPYHFFFPDQLAAYDAHPTRMFAAYSAVAVGTVLLCPAVVVLAQRIAVRRPTLAVWGGALVVFGLLGRVYHAGSDRFALRLVDVAGVRPATCTVAATYGGYYVLSALSGAIMLGWVVLAVGARRAGVLGAWRARCLAAVSALPIGVLKGTTPLSIVAVSSLAIALVPLRLTVLREGPAPRPRAVLGCSAAVLATLAASVLLDLAA